MFLEYCSWWSVCWPNYKQFYGMILIFHLDWRRQTSKEPMSPNFMTVSVLYRVHAQYVMTYSGTSSASLKLIQYKYMTSWNIHWVTIDFNSRCQVYGKQQGIFQTCFSSCIHWLCLMRLIVASEYVYIGNNCFIDLGYFYYLWYARSQSSYSVMLWCVAWGGHSARMIFVHLTS